ncbi:Uu.00g083830.m01.CDS01 [Anthostomella pinea]|uniref:Uu.00g083830.m01.CDS01 n=1 Tax=Anthostomella pinea TaxID=933095 RepID=A0AAI8VMB1_9PEZI|nr:Uu.00g083830.m01.CDS01 [Anthostomella pinea]
MPPRIPRTHLRSVGHQNALLQKKPHPERQSVCLFCSLSPQPSLRPARHANRRGAPPARRLESTVATSDDAAFPNTRKDLEHVLIELQKHAANYVNLSRLQLALSGLRQTPGNESIRVAILALANESESNKTAKEVLKLLLADPLKAAEQWEQEVDQHNLSQPMIVRVGATERQEDGSISVAKNSLLHEVNVSSATLNGYSLELLFLETNPFATAQEVGAMEGFEESVLVPTVDIPISSTGRYSPITTPVHKALIVADGILGAASVVSMPTFESQNVISAAVNLPDYKPVDTASLPFTPIDVGTANTGLGLVRNNLRDAIEYEHLWFQSNLPKLVEWLKADIFTTPDNTTKPPVKELIASLLRNTSAAIQVEEARKLGASLSSSTKPAPVSTLRSSLESWAESAHSELQEQLDAAFASKRWRKLGWWKLFWRVDDVGMLTSDILNQRFLPGADRSAIFLAGRMKEAGVPLAPMSIPSEHAASVPPSSDVGSATSNSPSTAAASWPMNIPATRHYLQTETIPALQALAQKLVVQTLTTSGLTTALGTLVYVGTLTTTLYEAGAVAALGIVWSMRRMQKRWEAAREFWEGEVREEGRKAVRGVEGVVGNSLSQAQAVQEARGKSEGQAGLEKAKDLVQKAQELLLKLK